MYNFLFDKKSLVLLLTGLGVAGGVLFFAGVLVGVQWGLPLGTAPVASPPYSTTKPAAFRAVDRPCRPEPRALPPALSPEPAAAPPVPEPVAPEPQPEPAPVTPVMPAAVAPAPAVAQAVPRTPEPKAAPEPADGPGRFSLQIGAFRDARNSEKVIQDLQARGYEPYVIEQRGRSLLRTVRIGRYADRAEALRAASELRRREGMEAIVRPIGS